VSEYAKRLFPEGQRKADPEGEKDVPFGEDITGIYADIHASGGYGEFYLLGRIVLNFLEPDKFGFLPLPLSLSPL
jgi:hypothetical protein